MLLSQIESDDKSRDSRRRTERPDVIRTIPWSNLIGEECHILYLKMCMAEVCGNLILIVFNRVRYNV